MTIDFPSTLTQGDSLVFKTYISDYLPSNGYTLHLAIRGLETADIVATSNDQNQYVLTLSTSTTSALSPGVYKAIFYVVNGIERTTLQSRELDVIADPVTLNTIDLRTHEQIMLDAIEAFMQGRATKGQLDHIATEIDGKKLQRMNMLELLQLRDHYKSKVMSQKNRAPQRYLYHFVR